MNLLERIARPAAWIVVAVVTTACAATQPIRVLGKGERRFISSVGGPLLPHHAPTGFIPYTNVGMMWGRSENVTATANVHVLAAAFGIAGIDLGLARRVNHQDGIVPEVTGQGQLYLFTGSGGSRAFPSATATASWAHGSRTLSYLGANLTGQFTGGTGVLASPFLGLQRDVTRRLTLQLEGKWMAANADMSRGLFEGENSVDGKGGLALQLGVQVKR
jgi:hypothetical protein